MTNTNLKPANSTVMLQILIDGQTSIKEDLKRLENKVDNGFKTVNKRIDTLGTDLAVLEDDAPTREEHDKLEKRVRKLEVRVLEI